MCKKLFFLLALLLLFSFNVRAELIAYYPFDGDATDAAANPADGTLVGGPTFEAGKFGDAIKLDGSTQWVNCGNPDKLKLTGGTTVTIMCWAQCDSDAPNYASMVTKGIGSEGYRLFGWTPGDRVIHWGVNGSYIRDDGAGSPNNLDDAAWHHVAGTYDGATLILYIDGQEVLSGAAAEVIADNANEVWIGNNSNSTARQWKGMLDEVAIIDGDLTQQQIED